MPVKEKLRQKLMIGTSHGFQPTVNDRTKKMYSELGTHAKLIKGMQKHVRHMQKATDGMLGMVMQAYSTEQPHDYAIAETTPTKAKSEPVAGGISEAERQAKTAEVDAIRGTLGSRMEEEVYAPSNEWLQEVRAAKGDLKALEQTRLALDAQRRRASKAEFKQIKQERNTGESQADSRERSSEENRKLEEMKTAFENEEAAVYDKLRELVKRSTVVFDCMEKAFAVGDDVMNKAQACAPKGSAMAPTNSDAAATLPPANDVESGAMSARA